MLQLLANWLDTLGEFPGLGLFQFITFRAAASAITALILSFIIGPKVIRKLKSMQIGEQEKKELTGLGLHADKSGTPSMGGIIVIFSFLIPTLLWADITNIYVILITTVTIMLGIVGFIDDYLKIIKKKRKGLVGKYKVFGQIIAGLLLGGTIYFMPELFSNNFEQINTLTTIPFSKNFNFDFDFLYIPMVILVLVATSNAVNLTDGLDGLAIGTSGIVVFALAFIAYFTGNSIFANYLNIIYLPGSGELTVFAAGMLGAALGFLWYNAYPAQVFMGDTGSLALGAAIGGLCILIKKEFLLIILGGIFFVETLSVIMQKLYFKYTKRKYGEGRRLFRVAPIHHHFEKKGLHESKIVTRFYIVGIILAILTMASFKVR